jgi:hypothetical protein
MSFRSIAEFQPYGMSFSSCIAELQPYGIAAFQPYGTIVS